MRHARPPEGKTLYKLTDSQVMLLWEEPLFSSKRRSGEPPSNVLYFHVIVPKADREALTQAYNRLIETNDGLRLRLCRLGLSKFGEFLHDYSYIMSWPLRLRLCGIRQYIVDHTYRELPVVRVSDRKAFEAYLERRSWESLDLFYGDLVEAEWIVIDSTTVVLLIRFQHILADGYSFRLLLTRLNDAYNQALRGEFTAQDNPSITRYFEQDQSYRCSQALQKDRLYWKNRFHNQPRYSFPVGKTPVVSANASVTRTIEDSQYKGLRALSTHHGCSVYGLLMTLVAFTVYRLTGQTNFAIFTLTHGRFDIKSKKTVGEMINMLPIFYNLDCDKTFEQLIESCNVAYLESLHHSRFPFNEIVKFYLRLSILHGFIFNHAWLVPSSIDFESNLSGKIFEHQEIDEKILMHQFFLEVDEWPNQYVKLRLKYQIARRTELEVERYMDSFLSTIQSVIDQPGQKLGSLMSQVENARP